MDTKDSALIVLPKDDRFFTYVAPEGKIFEGHYRFPGGKLEVGENYIQALHRELKEEFGVQLENIVLLHQKPNVIGGLLYLCSGRMIGEPEKQDDSVGYPEFLTADELLQSNAVPNCKLALSIHLNGNNEEMDAEGLIRRLQTFPYFFD